MRWSFDNGFINSSSWAVLNGNPGGTQPTMQFIQQALQPEGQLKLFELLGNGPSNSATEKLMSAKQLEANCASEENLKKQIALNAQWYADNYSKALEEYLTRLSK
ncbi:hypothetical protein D3C76_845820 [compost metagenome]